MDPAITVAAAPPSEPCEVSPEGTTPTAVKTRPAAGGELDKLPSDLRVMLYTQLRADSSIVIQEVPCVELGSIPPLLATNKSIAAEGRPYHLKNVVYHVKQDWQSGSLRHSSGLDFLHSYEKKDVLGIKMRLPSGDERTNRSLLCLLKPFITHPDFRDVQIVSMAELAVQQQAADSDKSQSAQPRPLYVAIAGPLGIALSDMSLPSPAYNGLGALQIAIRQGGLYLVLTGAIHLG